MSVPLDPDARARLNAALRLAFGVTAGLLIETMRGAALPMIAPIIALQLLAAMPRPPGKKVLVVLCGATVISAVAAYIVAVMTVDDPLLYAMGVGMLYLWGFALAFQPKLAPVGVMTLTMTVVVTGLATASTAAALGIVFSLFQSVVIGLFIVFLAHAVLPSAVVPAAPAPPPDPGGRRLESLPVTTRALVATLVILPAHLYLFAQTTGAMLVLMTTATMLRQPGLDASARYSIAFALGNLIGAAVAAIAMFIVSTQDGALLMLSVTAAGAMALAWLSALGPRWRAMTVPGMVAFVVLYGLIFSPYIDQSEVAILERSIMVVVGAIYALGAVSVLSPFVGQWLRRRAGAAAAG